MKFALNTESILRCGAVAIMPAVIAVQIVLGLGATAQASVTPAQRACTAFARWDHARTMPNLFALLTASERAPWVPVGTDVVVLYTDWRDHDTFDRADDIRALGQDCRR
jgi:hypothetical protein